MQYFKIFLTSMTFCEKYNETIVELKIKVESIGVYKP